MQLYFIRHGQSVNNELWDKTRSSNGRSHDPELTEIGQRQAHVLARFLCETNHNFKPTGHDLQNNGGFGITHIYSSLMKRAVATGEAVAVELDLPLMAWVDVHEVGGIYEYDLVTGQLIGQPGSSRDDLLTQFPHLILPATLGQAGWWNRPFEAVDDRLPRARRFLNDLMERHGNTEDRVAVISHGDFYNHFLAVLLNDQTVGRFWFSLNNVGITRFIFEPEMTRIVYMNRVDFLPRDLVT